MILRLRDDAAALPVAPAAAPTPPAACHIVCFFRTSKINNLLYIFVRKSHIFQIFDKMAGIYG